MFTSELAAEPKALSQRCTLLGEEGSYWQTGVFHKLTGSVTLHGCHSGMLVGISWTPTSTVADLARAWTAKNTIQNYTFCLSFNYILLTLRFFSSCFFSTSRRTRGDHCPILLTRSTVQSMKRLVTLNWKTEKKTPPRSYTNPTLQTHARTHTHTRTTYYADGDIKKLWSMMTSKPQPTAQSGAFSTFLPPPPPPPPMLLSFSNF